MSLTDEALWIIDRNLDGELSLGAIAAACGVSRFHMAHAFGQGAGTPVMDYVRARRLSEAAERLAAGAGSVLNVALEAGYGSHEAFSRAFRARLGVTPETVKRRGSTAGLPLAARRFPTPAPVRLPEPVHERGREILAVGLAERGRLDEALQSVPSQWRRFIPDFGAIEHRCDPIPLGVMSEVDDDGAMTYLCAAQVSAFGAAPPGLTRMRIAPADYAVFHHSAHISALPATYAAIFNDWLPARGLTVDEAPLIERHQSSFDYQTGLGGLRIWVPIKPRA